MRSLRQAVLIVFLCAVLGAADTAAFAQDFSQQSATSGGSAIVRLAHTRHPLATEAQAIGRVEGGRVFQRMLLLLSSSPTQEASLEQLLDDQQNPKSLNYHHWLSAAQFGAQFGSSDIGVQTAINWLQASGFTVERVAGSKRWIEFSGTSAQVENAFYTLMNYYRVQGETYVANATDLSIPAAMVGITRGVVFLHNFRKRSPVHEFHGTAGRTADGSKTKFSTYLTASETSNTYLAPGDFAAIYNTKGLLSSGIDGSGVSIAVTAQSDIELTDVQQFRKIFGLKQNDPNVLMSGPDPGFVDQSDSEEAQLDVEWAGAVAPGATINLIVAGSTDTTDGVDLAAAYAIDNKVAPILTYTYGSCENALGSAGNAFYSALWQQAAAEGITVFVASGDNGAAGCDSPSGAVVAQSGLAVNGIAATPYNVAVGGTQFAEGSQTSTYWSVTNTADYSSVLGYIPESAWNESCDPTQPASAANCILGDGDTTLLASGGGASTVYSKPSWQAASGVPADNARDVPDVALAAGAGHDEAVYCSSLAASRCQIDAQENVTGLTLVGGTSLAAPSMAGILALVEQKNAVFQGQINYLLYHLAQVQGNSCNASNQTNPTAQNSCVFYDVTGGNNEVPCAGASPGCSSAQSGTDGFTSGQVAGPGYDLATGLGSVNAANLAAAWKDATLAASQITLAASSNSFVHGQPGSSQVKLIAPASVTGNGEVSLNASVTGNPANPQVPYPTGVVEFWDSVNGTAAQLLLAQPLTSAPGGVSVYAARLKLTPGSHSLYVHYRGDTNWQPANSAAVSTQVGTFTLSISPATIGIVAGNPANATITITPSGGFAGTVSFTCPSGGTFLPAGYSCTLAGTVPVNGSTVTTPLTLTPTSSSSTAAVKPAGILPPPLGVVSSPALPYSAGLYACRFSFLALGSAFLILAFGWISTRNRNCRNFLAACGLIVCVGSVVLGCGGGGGSGPFSTTTTLVSSNLKVAFGQAVTFTVTVKPNGPATPSGAVQLYDNGQAYGGVVNVSAGIATFLTTNLPVGVHNFSAEYRGDSGTLPSTSATIVQVVTGTTALQISGGANGISETADVTVMVN